MISFKKKRLHLLQENYYKIRFETKNRYLITFKIQKYILKKNDNYFFKYIYIYNQIYT